jgi:predicted TIM-barrel fold metal-dependent hydrolase
MELDNLDRRELLKTVSAAAGLIGGRAGSAEAQAVKWSSGTEAPKLKALANATDCHHHVYDAKYPVDPKATLRPADAFVEDYRALKKRIGTTRNVSLDVRHRQPLHARCVWGSDWPHPTEKDKPDDAVLFDLLLDWVPDEKARHRVLVENPAVLYGF